MPGNAEKHGQLTRAQGEMELERAGKFKKAWQETLEGQEGNIMSIDLTTFQKKCFSQVLMQRPSESYSDFNKRSPGAFG